jgi:ADP-ribose pyrophosphatase YjhB (NUDIX family)
MLLPRPLPGLGQRTPPSQSPVNPLNAGHPTPNGGLRPTPIVRPATDPRISNALGMAQRGRFAEGGGLNALHEPHLHPHKIRPPRAYRHAQHRIHSGPIHSSVAGRTDHLPIHVHSGSYVIPADIVSGMGEGNTIAGFKHLRRMFGGMPRGEGSAPYGQSGGPYGMATGGKVKHHAAGILFKSPDDKILLVRRAGRDHHGEWGLPGGGIEKGETAEQAARRELREETGHSYDGELAPATRRVREGVDFTTFMAHAEPFQPKLNDEHDAHAWVTPDEAKSMDLHPGVRSTLARVAKAVGGSASGVPIVAAGGEYVVHPDEVEEVGAGDMDRGHEVLDKFVKRMRKELIGTLKKLAPPKKD